MSPATPSSTPTNPPSRPPARARADAPAGRGGRRRTALSLEAIVEAAIAALDRDGAEKLTLRSLAAELNSGVASLYWYASGKDDLMAVVADEVLGRALAEYQRLVRKGRVAPEDFAKFPLPPADRRTSAATASALTELRTLSLCLFAQMLQHRWLAGQLIQAGPDKPNALRTWEATGQILQRMELTTAQQFHASLSITNYASGMGAEISQRQDQREAEDAEQMFREQLERWDHASTQEFPFVHSVLGEFRRHDDRSEFVAGLELLLSGIERLTWK